MRLRDIEHILTTELPTLVISPGEPTGTPMGAARRSHRRRLESSLRAIAAIAPFSEAALAALGHPALAETGEPTLVLDSTIQEFQSSQLQPLIRRVRDLLDTIKTILPKEPPFQFAFRLPDGTWDLETMKDELDELKLIFDEPVARLTGERPTVEAFDRGSFYIDLKVASDAALLVVTTLCVAAKALMNMRGQYGVQERQFSSLDIDLDMKKAAAEAYKAALAKATRQFAEGVVNKAGKKGDHEAVNFVVVSLDRLSTQFERNAQVLLAQSAPEEIKALMPKAGETPKLPELLIKELLAENPSTEADGSAEQGGAEENSGEGNEGD